MQGLKDKLLQAGLVDKKAARKARQEARKDRKKMGRHRQEQEKDQERRQRHEQRLQEQRERAQQEQERLNAEAAEQAAAARLRDMVQRACLERIHGDGRPFYFCGPDSKIRRFCPTAEVAQGLRSGRLAVVADDGPDAAEFAVVPDHCAARLEEARPSMILFWNKPGAPDDNSLPTYGSGR